MRLVTDLIACQTPSRNRGIGRYTLEFSRALAAMRGHNEMICMADPLLSQPYEELRQEFIRRLPAGGFLPYFHEPIPEYDPFDENGYPQLASALICQARQAVSPDMVLTPSLFEEPGIIVPFPQAKRTGYKQAVILYDLIPYLYQEYYLDRNPIYKEWYLKRYDSLKNFDLLLAISDSTRQDAIRLLDLSPEKVVNISSAVGNQFHKLELTEDEKEATLQSLGIIKPFVFYLGGNDIRKNMEGAVEIFASLPQELIETHQLVLNDVGDETVFRNKVRSAGLADQDVVIIGKISDDDLLKLYNLCTVFIFPSLYEGFGLPILEAMACGAPVITANNSSLPEAVGRDELLFDARDPKQAASLLAHVLTDSAFREELSSYGVERARQFSWEKSAHLAWQSMESLQQESLQTRVFSSAQIEKSRPRIAFLSPLPPQQSGIADYSADLLPYLASYFDIDLFVEPGVEISENARLGDFNVYPWTELLSRREDYATVVYQFGNSPFHSHMFELEKKFPGVVVLHDFFLSGIIAHLHSANGTLPQVLDGSHGLRSLVDFKNKGINVVCDWPINWQVLRQAKEVIVHSVFQKQLLDEFYNPGWQPRLNVIPQLRTSEPEITPKMREQAREHLKIPKESFLICSFGHMVTTKMDEESIEAFLLAQRTVKRDCQLVFVGDCPDISYYNKITGYINDKGLSKQVHITGFVDPEDYRRYLMAADAAVQLRQRSRGETSRAVLDCMAYGLPVILNAHGTMDDYRDEDVVKIKDPVNLQELAQAMSRIENDETFQLDKGAFGRKWIMNAHNPESAAAAYADVIERAIESDDRVLIKPAIDALVSMKFPVGLVDLQARYAAENMNMRNHPRILLNVTLINREDARTGIQRVVKRIIKELFQMSIPSLQIEPVYLSDGELKRANRFLEALLEIPAESLEEEQSIYLRPGDTLVMLDSSWEFYDDFLPIFNKIRLLGGKIVTIVYDLIPVDFPHFFPKPMPSVFSRWLTSACAESDQLICISGTVAEGVASYRLKNKIGLGRQLDVDYFHLGADIPAAASESTVRKQVASLAQKLASPLFLTVGTLEPRKGHAFTLDAFESLWDQGEKSVLVFAGKFGWNISDVENRIWNHPMLNKRLFFIENPTDAELEILYSKATALIAASTAEGFGLPIVEAALHHVPTLASDIPVFHEVGGDGAIYFALDTPNSLAQAVHAMAGLSAKARLDLVNKVKVSTWKQSAEAFLDILGTPREPNP